MTSRGLFLALAGIFLSATAMATRQAMTPEAYAQKLHQRLAGVPLMPADPKLAQMVALVKDGKLTEAAHVATEQSGFYSIVVRDWAAAMSNRDETPLVEFDDFQALAIGITRDNLDGRQLLTANFRYEADPALALPIVTPANNLHFVQFEARHADPKKFLVKREPQWDEIQESAGVLTTRAWAKAHMAAGTNRRATEYTFRQFLCSPISQWKDTGLPDYRVRRDVDRKPGGDPMTYQTMCRSCHAGMDGLTGAFANFDFSAERLVYFRPYGVAPKMNVNGHVFPGGYTTADTHWVNLVTQHHNESFGWRGPLEGVGVGEFGAMVANARGFSRCMAQRVFKKVCKRELAGAELGEFLEKAADRFEASGYKLRALFEDLATQNNCL